MPALGLKRPPYPIPLRLSRVATAGRIGDAVGIVSGDSTDALIKTLRQAARHGQLHDFAPEIADTELDPAAGATWPREREVPADLLRTVLLEPDLRPDPRGLHLRGVLVTGNLDVNHVVLPCPLVLTHSHLTERATLNYATLPRLNLSICHLPGLSLIGARLEGGAFLGGLTATGGVNALNAQITGPLDLRGAILNNEGGWALNLDGARVDGVAPLNGLTATGAVRAPLATITSALDLEGAILNNEGGYALNLEVARVEALYLRNVRHVQGTLILRRARIGYLIVEDSPVGRLPGPLVASGWQIQDIRGGLRSDRRLAAKWLATQPEFVPQPWHALADVYARNGQPADARRLRLEAAHRTTKNAPPGSKQARWLYGLVVGYGYYPLLAAVWLVALLIIASALIATQTKTFVPTNPTAAATAISRSATAKTTTTATTPRTVPTVTGATACARLGNRYPCLRPLLFSLDVVLPPTVGAGQANAWRPAANWLAYLLTGLKVFGWVLTALLLAGVTGLLRKV